MPRVKEALLPIVKKYFENDPIAAAQSLETMSEEDAVSVLKALPVSLVSKAFRYLQTSYAATLLQNLNPELFRQIISSLEPHQGAAMFMYLPKDVSENYLQHIPDNIKRQIQEYLNYPVDSVGRLMSMNFLSFYTNQRVKEVVQKIRQLAQKQYPASYGYVIDMENHLVGVINMRDLLLASPDTFVQDIMTKDIFSINCLDDKEKAANELSKRNFFAAPVVNSENKLVGIIKAEQLIKEVQEEGTEDIQKMFGAGKDERAFSPILMSLKNRLPWLHVNLLTAFLAAGVVALFQDVIARITILAVFLPVVAGQGGNAGNQSLAIVMRGLVLREVPPEKQFQLVFKEAFLGTVSGITTGAVTALVAWLWHGNPFLGVVIGLAMVVNLFVAGFSGAAIPIIMKKLGLDPAQCSSIILTTITDVVGFFLFLGFAVLFYNYLI